MNAVARGFGIRTHYAERRAPARAVVAAALVLVALLPAGGTAPLAALQVGAEPSEPRLLADAQRREAVGDLSGSERVLEELLERYPTSTGGLFAYERILRRQERVADILPAVDRFLRRDAGASGARLLKLRVLVEIDSLEEARAAADAWIAVDPMSPDPYRESAAVFESAFGPEAALGVLRRGTAVLDDAPLAIETGDLLLRMGDRPGALREWSRALGDEGAHLPAVLQRVGALPPAERSDVLPLVEALANPPTTQARRRAAAQIAVEAGLEDEAMALAGEVIPGMAESARRGFLVGLARQAEARAMDRVTLWIYRTLREATVEAGEARALDRQIVELAAVAGDTALALAAQERLATDLPPASTEQRRATANSIRLSVAVDPPEAVQRRLDRFRGDFPDAPELDALAVTLAALWVERGNDAAAHRVLQEVRGPRSALQRAYLELERAEPDMERVMLDLRAAVDGFSGSGATDVIQLMALMNRVGEEAALLAGRASALAHRGRAARAVEILREGVRSLPREDHPPLLALGARLAVAPGSAATLAEAKGDFLRILVGDFPESPEAPEAMLALARHRLQRSGGVEEAVGLLETLILTRPESPVVPDARRELQRLRQRPPADDGEGRP